jgi:hypothetical protein
VVAFTALIVWWVRHFPGQARWLRGVLVSRGEALEEFDTQPRTGDRDEWDGHVADAVLLTHEAVGLDDPMHDVDFTEFETEFADDRKTQRLVARLEERAN